jgi:hypothetical protein
MSNGYYQHEAEEFIRELRNGLDLNIDFVKVFVENYAPTFIMPSQRPAAALRHLL